MCGSHTTNRNSLITGNDELTRSLRTSFWGERESDEATIYKERQTGLDLPLGGVWDTWFCFGGWNESRRTDRETPMKSLWPNNTCALEASAQ